MKYLLGSLIILGLLCTALLSCQSPNQRDLSSKQTDLEKNAYLMIQNEINTLLQKTDDLKRYKVIRPTSIN